MAQPPQDILGLFEAMLDRYGRKNYKGILFYHPEDIKRWMLARQPEANVSNVTKLLQAVHNQSAFAPTAADKISNALVVFAILLELKCGHLIHIFQRHCSDTTLDYVLLESIKDELVKSTLPYPSDIIEQFDVRRWSYCPAKVEDMHKDTKALNGGRWILPFCRKENIGIGGTATVAQVLIQEDLVPDKLRSALASFRVDDELFGACVRLAVKSFADENVDVYRTETQNFGGISNLEGVVKCFGWYEVQHLNPDGGFQSTHNILLEYGDQDLDEYLALRYPPVLNSEIINLWEDVFAVASTLKEIHNFKYRIPGVGTRIFDGWHGDVKPANILFIQGKFKLADFGFVKFEPNRHESNPRTTLRGVTHTFGAPEVDPGRLKRKTLTKHTQEIDTWSFGCVLSSIATWVVLGSASYENYPHVRTLAIEALQKSRERNPEVSIPFAKDAFHDGVNVLPAVKNWHDYLRNVIRKSDTITCDVLDLVEGEMLRSHPQDRLTSAKLVDRLKEIVQKAKDRYKEDLDKRKINNIPAETLKALLTLDSEAPPDVFLQARSSETLSDRSLVGELEKRSRAPTTRVKKQDRLEEMVKHAKVAGRQEALETALKELGEPFTPPDVIFETPKPMTTRLDREPPRPPLSPPDTGFAIQNVGPSHTRLSLSLGTPPKFQDHSAPIVPAIVTPESGPHNAGYEPVPLIQRQSTFSDPSFNALPIGRLRLQLRDEWNAERKLTNFLTVLRNKIPYNKNLKDFIKDRDIKFLVDNGWHMRPHWKYATSVLETLAMYIGPLDENGLDLLFTIGSSNYKVENVKGFDIPTRFKAAMTEAKADDHPTMYLTAMTTELGSILREYRRDMSRKLTIIVLTTGIWEGEPDDVETLIAGNIREMCRIKPDFQTERWCTFEFVSFGNDKAALDRMKNLDDKMKDRFNIPDVIDTEPWHGDPKQMILGSIKQGMDESNSVGDGGQAASERASPHSASAHQARPDSRLSAHPSHARSPSGSSFKNKVLDRFRKQTDD